MNQIYPQISEDVQVFSFFETLFCHFFYHGDQISFCGEQICWWRSVSHQDNQISGSLTSLRCPETLFISHENANFFSVVRVVQGEAKASKNNGVLQGKVCLLPALKIGTFSGK